MGVNVCIVVFNRYDLLARLLASIDRSTLQPDAVYIIDNGHDMVKVRDVVEQAHLGMTVDTLTNSGSSLPEAWNWFLENVPDDRVIASDDIEFHPETLRLFHETPGPFVGMHDGKSSAYACFLLRDACVERVGLFDETISPDYLYFEDCDYHRRMALLGMLPTPVVEDIFHGGQQSWEYKSEAERQDHHQRFVLAQSNYLRKWGGLPGREVYTVPYDGHQTPGKV
jgi:GT2 family glycosyltransferase